MKTILAALAAAALAACHTPELARPSPMGRTLASGPACYDPHPPARSKAVGHAFNVLTGHPHGWPGHVKDHVIPRCACGKDAVSNLQWQRADSAAMKDNLERAQCAQLRKAAKAAKKGAK